MSPNKPELSTAENVGGGVMGAAAEMVAISLGMPPNGIVAAVGTTFGTKFAGALIAEHHRRVSVALRAAEAASRMSREELDDLIDDDPSAVPLVIRLLQAAGGAGDESVLELLGMLAGEALCDPSRAYEQETLMLALDGLTEAHLRMMVVLAQIGTNEVPDRLMTVEEVARDAVEVPELIRMLGMGLLSRGLLATPFYSDAEGDMEEGFALSELGYILMDAATRRAALGE